jgi:glycerol-3-phosphate dehydrogenase
MTYKTDRNVIGRQITSAAEEVVTAIRVAYDAGLGLTVVAPAAFTADQIKEVFAGLPTVTGTQTLDVSGCAGVGDLVATDDDAAIAKGWTITLV